MIHLGEIKKYKENSKGTELLISVPEHLQEAIEKCKANKIEIRIDDGRRVSAQQRKKYYASLKDIADHTGNAPETLHSYFKLRYLYEVEDKLISLSNCSMTEARKLINIQVDFIIKEGIPLTALGVDRTDDINRYLYMCLLHRKCVITGKGNADIHHCLGSKVGMGNNRKEVNHIGREVIALSREWHNKVHAEGEAEIFKQYKVYGIELDEMTRKKLKL